MPLAGRKLTLDMVFTTYTSPDFSERYVLVGDTLTYERRGENGVLHVEWESNVKNTCFSNLSVFKSYVDSHHFVEGALIIW